jgi:glyoxylase-like metal-dependent hydrolase (beta-lactamase superfamily II)
MDAIALTPKLHFLRFPVGHVYLWQEADGLTLIDTGVAGSGQQIARAIRLLGRDLGDLRRLVLTHFHADHVGAAAEVLSWADTAVVAHRADAPVVRGLQPGPPPDLADWERPLYEQAMAQVPPASPAPVPVDHEVDDGDVLTFGGGAHVVAVPGHTPGSIAIYLPESRVLFTGDAAARGRDGNIICGVFSANRAQAAGSLKRLATLDVEIACFGHGEPVTRDAAAWLHAAASRAGE